MGEHAICVGKFSGTVCFDTPVVGCNVPNREASKTARMRSSIDLNLERSDGDNC